MKKLLLSLLGLGTVGCQQSSPPLTKAPVALAGKQVDEKQPVAVPVADSAGSLSKNDSLLLRQHNLAPLWANQADYADSMRQSAMEGFYGSPPYRISFCFKKVTRDARQPNVFHVEGLDRYKKVITPFTGTIIVQAIRPFTDEMYAEDTFGDSTAHPFTAAGRFTLAEDPTTKGAGTYYGQALLDFYINQQGHMGQARTPFDGGNNNPTKGCGLLFSGYQISDKTGQRRPVAFANFYRAVVPTALKKLRLGDRIDEVNPNMARLGWNEAWENDEWWADAPKPKLAL